MGKIKVVDNTIHSAKVFVYKMQNGILSYLVIKEPEGIYGFPGGAQEIDDKSITATANRELTEETGLTQKSCHIIETSITYEFMHTDTASDRFGKKGILHVFLAEYNGSEPIHLESELMSFAWESEQEVFTYIKSSYDYLTDVFKEVTRLVHATIA